MSFLEIVFSFYGFAASTASLAGAINIVTEKMQNKSANELFEDCFVRAVSRSSLNLIKYSEKDNPKHIKADRIALQGAITKLKNFDLTNISVGEKETILEAIAPYFRNCVDIPGHSLSHRKIDREISVILSSAMGDFFHRLPLSDKASKEIIIKALLEGLEEQKTQSKNLDSLKNQLSDMAAVQEDVAKSLSYLNPTVIQKESGRPEFNNPFRIVKAEEFDHDYPLLASLFRKPESYELIRGRDNLILCGARGCGKSMILRSLSAPAAIEIEARIKGKTNLTFKQSGIDYLGVYIKLAKGYFDEWKQDSALSLDAASQLFQHAFNLQLLKATVEALQEYRDRYQILSFSNDNEVIIVKKILELLGCQDTNSHDFGNLRSIIIRKERAIGDYLGALRLGGNASYSGGYTYVHNFPKEFCRIILDTIQDLAKCRIYFLLDEFENLSEFQQTVVNTITKLRPDSLVLKVATRAMGLKSRVDLQGEPIQSPRDFCIVNLDYDVKDAQYSELLFQISKMRLQGGECLESNIRNLLPDYPDTYPEFGKDHITKLVAAHLKEKRSFCFSELDTKDQNEWIHRLGVAMVYRESHANNKRHWKLYAGYKAFVELSSGIISNFLELCKMAFYLAESKGINVRGGETIDPSTQNEAIYLVSRASLDLISRNIPNTGPMIARLVLDMADIFRQKLLFHDSEPEAARILIKDPESFDNKIHHQTLTVLDDAVRWSVLHSEGPSTAYFPKHKTDVRPDDFRLNRILSPTLRISHRQRWRTSFRVNEIANLINKDKRKVTKKNLLKKHSGQAEKGSKKKIVGPEQQNLPNVD